MIDDRYLHDLSRVFSTPAIRELADTGGIDLLTYMIHQSKTSGKWFKSLDLSSLFTELYERLKSDHRVEYVYKNAINNKWFLGKHSPITTTLLSEFRVNTSRVDLVMVNSVARAYEIKTELDDFTRLPDQLSDCRRVFQNVSVVVAPSGVEEARRVAPIDVGIYVLTSRYTLHEIRPSTSNGHTLSPSAIMASLRRSEYIEILKRLLGEAPSAPNGRIYRECELLFSRLDPSAIHAEMVKVLKRRKPKGHLVDTLEQVPDALKHVWLSSGLSQAQAMVVLDLLSRPYGVIW